MTVWDRQDSRRHSALCWGLESVAFLFHSQFSGSRHPEKYDWELEARPIICRDLGNIISMEFEKKKKENTKETNECVLLIQIDMLKI